MFGEYSNSKWLVTGAGRGIGRAIVEELSRRGATIFAVSKNPDNLKTLKAEFPHVSTICVDLSNWAETRRVIEDLEVVDCLVNNAGIVVPAGFMEVTPDDFDSMMNVNLKAVINISQIVSRKMIESGKRGSIVNVSSVAGRKAFPNYIGYGCTKSALEWLTKTMAVVLGPHKIRVNSICPAAVQTDMLAQIMEMNKQQTEEFLAIVETRTPTKATFMPMDDIVNTILFLGSKATSQLTGESLAVDGGYLLT